MAQEHLHHYTLPLYNLQSKDALSKGACTQQAQLACYLSVKVTRGWKQLRGKEMLHTNICNTVGCEGNWTHNTNYFSECERRY